MSGNTVKSIVYYHIIKSPWGQIGLAATTKGLCNVCFFGDQGETGFKKELVLSFRSAQLIKKKSAILDRAVNQLESYFSGKLKKFSLKLDVEGTDFQEKVWGALGRIPYGKTRTYGAVAKDVGSPLASRAIGMACNRNPVGIIVPCHRVIGANGSLVGYAGGVKIKEQLLRLELAGV